MKCIEKEIKIALDFRKTLQTSSKEFTGKDFITYLQENNSGNSLSRAEWTNFVQRVYCSHQKTDNMLYSLNENFLFRDTSQAKYKFIQDVFEDFKNSKFILNVEQQESKEKFFFQYEDSSKRPSINIIPKIEEVLGNIYAEFCNEKVTALNYRKLYDSHMFQWVLLPLLRKLPYIDLSQMIGNEALIKAFFINIYNILVIHARSLELKKQILEKKLEFEDMSTMYKYVIGGIAFSLNDIKNGILGGNKAAVKTFLNLKLCSKPKFILSNFSPKKMFMIAKKDPRINFALNPGTKSGPSIRIYNETQLELDLELAVKNYVQSYVVIKEKKDKVYVFQANKLFFTTKEEFKNELNIFNFIIENIRDQNYVAELSKKYTSSPGNFSIKYTKFDWTINFTSNSNSI